MPAKKAAKKAAPRKRAARPAKPQAVVGLPPTGLPPTQPAPEPAVEQQAQLAAKDAFIADLEAAQADDKRQIAELRREVAQQSFWARARAAIRGILKRR